MNKCVVAFLFCLTSTIANAQIGPGFQQVPKSVVCGPLSTILKSLADKDIAEQPLWIGKDEGEKTNFAVFVNAQTGAFTILQFGQEIGCILGLGYKSETFKLVPRGQPL